MSIPAVGARKAIRAVPDYLKVGEGASKNFPFLTHVGIAITLGLGLGFAYKTWHWNDKRFIAQYYADLAKKELKQEEARQAAIQLKFKALEEELLSS